MEKKLRIAIIGGGPSGLFMFKKLVRSGRTDIDITIFEKKQKLGVGMPYSAEGANVEHITNVSGNEIPEIVTSITDWISTAPRSILEKFDITSEKYNDYKVLPRLLFGEYLSAQFDLLEKEADQLGIDYQVRYQSQVTDIIDDPKSGQTIVEVNGGERSTFDRVVVCSGHNWPSKYEGKVPGFYDSPYPPSKLSLKLDHPVAVKGASLTAIDAIRTLTRANGKFNEDGHGKLSYQLNPDSEGFKIIMHSRDGLLPAVRFHLKDPHLSDDDTLTRDEMSAYRAAHNGFLSLDHIFEHNFKEAIRKNDPDFFEKIRSMNMEEFVASVMDMREEVEPFHLFRAEYIEAERSIERHRSVYWKEVLAILSYSMNYPAKYLPAEDMQRLQKTLMPLISIVIAFVPQSSVEQLLALHQAGVLELVGVGNDSYVEPGNNEGAVYYYTDNRGKEQAKAFKTFVDCVGQPHLSCQDIPYKSLLMNNTISKARLRFKDPEAGVEQKKKDNDKVELSTDGNYYLQVPGIAINDNFQVLDSYGAYNPRLYMMAVPYIGGFNPDYSGLDFCDTASEAIIKKILNDD